MKMRSKSENNVFLRYVGSIIQLTQKLDNKYNKLRNSYNLFQIRYSSHIFFL